MRFATARTSINPPFPVTQAGHISQVTELTEVHDNLEARLLYLENEDFIWIHASCDNLGLDISIQKRVEDELSTFFNKTTHVTVSTTHSHHCGSPRNPKYAEFVCDTIIEAAKLLIIEEVGDLEVAYSTCFFDEVGKSRISHHTSESTAVDLFEIKKEGEVIADIIIHNVHPTILQANTPYFSAEYPGYMLRRMNETEPDVFHTFIQGADGDNSTRFTRPSQDYTAVEALGEKLFVKVMEMKKEEVASFPLKLHFESRIIPLKHEFEPIDMGTLPDDLSERELETIGFGQIMRQRLKDNPQNLKKEIMLSCVDFGSSRILFMPNEMFSWWRTQVDDSFCALGCYSNGYAPYMCGPDQHLLTYETFTDTVTRECKLNIVQLLNQWGKR